MAVVTTSSHPRKTPKRPLWIVIVLALVAVVAFVVLRKDDGLPVTDGEQAVADQAPTTAAGTEAGTNVLDKFSTPTYKTEETGTVAKEKEPLLPGVKRIALPNGEKLRIKLPKEGETLTLHARARTYEVDHEGNLTDVTPKPIFDNPVENQLVGMAVEGGTFIPGFIKGLSDEQAVDMLLKPVVINEDDPPDVVAKKEAVAELKQTALAYIQEGGGTFDDFVDEMYVYVKTERTVKAKSLRRIATLLKEGKVEEAKAFKAQLDATLEKDGYPAMKLPPHFQKKLQ